jgi:hypothetical protein
VGITVAAALKGASSISIMIANAAPPEPNAAIRREPLFPIFISFISFSRSHGRELHRPAPA